MLRYIIVNDRELPHKDGYPRRCCFCLEVLCNGYVREVGNRLPYCTYEHLLAAISHSEMKLLEYSA